MATTSPEMRKAILKQRCDLHQSMEAEFASYFATAERVLPDCAREPMFRFILRQLWAPCVGDLPLNWIETLATDYAHFKERNGWALAGNEGSGEIWPSGIQAMARLLCAVRRRQRLLEGSEK